MKCTIILIIVEDQQQYRFGIDSKFSNFVLEGGREKSKFCLDNTYSFRILKYED